MANPLLQHPAGRAMTREDMEGFCATVNASRERGGGNPLRWRVVNRWRDGLRKPTLEEYKPLPGPCGPNYTADEIENNERWLNGLGEMQSKLRSAGLACGALEQAGGRARFVGDLR